MKIISKLAALALAAALVAGIYAPVSAEEKAKSGTLGDNITYTYDDGTDTLTVSGTGEIYDENKSYPWKSFSSLKKLIIGEGITALGRSSFNSMKNLRFVELPSTLKVIDGYALAGADINELVIPEGVETIGENACASLKSLKKLTLPESLTEVGEDAFSGSKMLTSLNIPKNLTKIGEQAFASLDSVEEITVDAANPVYDSRDNCNAIVETATNTMITGCRVTSIPKTVTILDGTFWDFDNLKEFTVPDWVEEIGDKTFWSCSNLSKIDLGNGVKKIGSDVFYNCDKLESVTIPDSVTELGSMIFWDCDNLKNVKLPSKINYLPFGIFAGCYNMTEFNIPSNIVKLNQCALQSTGIEELVIPKTVLNIEKGVIQNSPNLRKLTVEEGNPKYDSRDDCNAIIETKTNTLIAGCSVTEIPNTVEALGKDAFEGQKMSYLDIPDSVTLLDENSIMSCNNLETLIIPKTVKKAKSSILLWSSNLKRILYTGTEEEWNAFITNSVSSNKELKAAEVIFNFKRDHTHTDGEIKEEAATCTKGGVKTTYCSYCFKAFESEGTPSLGHLPAETESVIQLPDCEWEGYAGIKCTRCGAVISQHTIPALGHLFESDSKYCLRGCGTENPDYIAPTEPSTAEPVTPTEPVTEPSPTQKPTEPAEKDEIKEGTPETQVDKTVKGLKNDKDVKGSVFSGLFAKQSKVKKTSIKISWSKIKGAKTYVIYGNKCGKSPKGKFNAFKKLKTVKKTSFTQKKLKKGTYYKYLVVAFDKNKKSLSTSKTLHIATKGGKLTNTKSITVKQKTLKLKVKKSGKIKTSAKLENKKLRLSVHRNTAFESSDKKVATVSSKGKVKAKSKGTCYVYAYAQNGFWAKTKIVVK